MKKNILLFDSDTLYATRLAEAFNRTDDQRFYARVVENAEEVKEIIERETVDLVLYAADYEEETGDWKVPKRKLTETEEEGGLFRYQPFERIAEQLFSFSSPDTGLKECAIVLFVQPIGYTGDRESILTARQLANGSRKRKLYISLNPLPDAEDFPPRPALDLSDILYELEKSGGDYAVLREDAFAEDNGLSFLYPVSMPEDIYQPSAASFCSLAEKLKESGQWDLIILQCASNLRRFDELSGIADFGILFSPYERQSTVSDRIRAYRSRVSRGKSIRLKEVQGENGDPVPSHKIRELAEEWAL